MQMCQGFAKALIVVSSLVNTVLGQILDESKIFSPFAGVMLLSS